MPTKYQEIPGWFNFEILYDRIAREAPDHSHLLEVGCWLGKSTCYLLERLRELNKSCYLLCVDTFNSAADEHMQRVIDEHGGSVRDAFVLNMQNAGFDDDLLSEGLLGYEAIVSKSLDAAEIYKACTKVPIFFSVFIDADHRYEAVKADIIAWLPLVQPGGYIGGHDYDQGGVYRAVNELFWPEEIEQIGNCWLVRVQ